MKLPDPDASILVKANFYLMVSWIILLIPSLTIWKDSLIWVIIMSQYAIISTHFTGWDTARAEEKMEEK